MVTPENSDRQLSNKELVTWKDSDEDRLKKNMEAALTVPLITDGEGEPRDLFHADAYDIIITSLVQLQYVDTLFDQRKLVEQALKRFADYRQQNLTTFRRALATEVRHYLDSTENSYYVVCPANISRNSLADIRWFNVRGVRLRVWKWSTAKRKLEVGEWKKERSQRFRFCESPFNTQFVPIVGSVTCRTQRAAFSTVEAAYDLLRALINMSFTFSRYHLQAGRKRRLGKIVPSPIYGIFDHNGHYLDSAYDAAPPHKYRLKTLPENNLDFVKKQLSHLDAPEKSDELSALLVDALRFYGQALDTANWSEAFLTLWQVLEIITYRDPGCFKMSKVRDRAKTLVGGHALLTELLEVSYDTRNALVHQGKFPEWGLEDVCMLKAVVEQSIQALDGLRRKFSSWHELELYYQYAKSHPSHRKDVVRTIQKIENG